MDRVPLGADAGVLSQMRLPGGGRFTATDTQGLRLGPPASRSRVLPTSQPLHSAEGLQVRRA